MFIAKIMIIGETFIANLRLLVDLKLFQFCDVTVCYNGNELERKNFIDQIVQTTLCSDCLKNQITISLLLRTEIKSYKEPVT